MYMKLLPLCLMLVFSSAASAQDYAEYIDREHFVSVVLPGEPMVEDIDYVTLDDTTVPARQYKAQRRNTHFTVTVVDLTGDENSVGSVRGAMAHEAWNIRKRVAERGGEIIYDEYAQISRVEGHQIQAVYPDGNRNSWQLLTQNRRLYIQEAVVAPGEPLPGLFLASLWVLDENGEKLRNTVDHNGQIVEEGRADAYVAE
jgi:hypothetical protein